LTCDLPDREERENDDDRRHFSKPAVNPETPPRPMDELGDTSPRMEWVE